MTKMMGIVSELQKQVHAIIRSAQKDAEMRGSDKPVLQGSSILIHPCPFAPAAILQQACIAYSNVPGAYFKMEEVEELMSVLERTAERFYRKPENIGWDEYEYAYVAYATKLVKILEDVEGIFNISCQCFTRDANEKSITLYKINISLNAIDDIYSLEFKAGDIEIKF